MTGCCILWSSARGKSSARDGRAGVCICVQGEGEGLTECGLTEEEWGCAALQQQDRAKGEVQEWNEAVGRPVETIPGVGAVGWVYDQMSTNGQKKTVINHDASSENH